MVVWVVVVLFVKEPTIVEPVPLAAVPVPEPVRLVVLVLVQLKVVPGIAFGLVIVISVPDGALLHRVWVVGVALTVGRGLTVIVLVVVEVHDPNVAVSVNVMVPDSEAPAL